MSDGPDHLYKYRSIESPAKERTRQIVASNALWFSKPEDFNDPFDCAPGFSMAAPAPVFRRYMMQLFRDKGQLVNRKALLAQLAQIRRDPLRKQNSPEFIATMRAQTWRTVNRAGVLSLSARPDRVLMWSHYAASHTGICLRFSTAPWAYPFRAAQRVVYCRDRPVLNPVLDDEDAIMAKTVLSKADFWEYEEEWRVISHPGSPVNPGGGPGLVTLHPAALDGIILGARASDADTAEVAEWVEGRVQPVELLRAVPNSDSFSLNIIPLVR